MFNLFKKTLKPSFPKPPRLNVEIESARKIKAIQSGRKAKGLIGS